MDARELEGKMGYLGMERAARKILLDEKLVHRSTLIGIDLSQGNDFTAFASLFPLDDYQSHTGKKGQKNDKVSD